MRETPFFALTPNESEAFSVGDTAGSDYRIRRGSIADTLWMTAGNVHPLIDKTIKKIKACKNFNS